MISFLADKLLPPNWNSDIAQRSQVGKRCGLLGIFANILLFCFKLAAAFFSGSVSIAADAANNLTDAGSSVVAFVGFKLAERPADTQHPFGHARYEYLSGLAVAAMIVVIGFEMARTSILKIITPVKTVFSGTVAVILICSIFVKLLLARINTHLGKKISSNALLAAGADCRSDCIATAGVLICTFISHYSDWIIDGYVGLVVALMILYSGIHIGRQTISPLLGEKVDPAIEQMIVDVLRSTEKILGFHDLMIHDYGPGQRFASVHVEIDMREDPLVCHTIISHIENKVLAKGVHLVIHHDPMITDDEEQNHMKECVKKVLTSIDQRISIHDFRLIREKNQNCLLFDMVLPDDLRIKQKKIKEMLDTAINLGDSQYVTFITYDVPGSSGEEFVIPYSNRK